MEPEVIFEKNSRSDLQDFEEAATYAHDNHSLFVSLTLGLLDILILGSKRNDFSQKVYNKFLQILTKIDKKLGNNDFEGLSKLIQIMNDQSYETSTLDDWLHYYFTFNFQGIVDRSIRMMKIMMIEEIEQADIKQHIQLNLNLNGGIRTTLLNKFCSIFDVTVIFYYSNLRQVLIHPKTSGFFPIIYLLENNEKSISYLTHKQHFLVKSSNILNSNLFEQPFSYVFSEKKIHTDNLSYNLPGLSFNVHEEVEVKKPGPNILQLNPSLPSPDLGFNQLAGLNQLPNQGPPPLRVQGFLGNLSGPVGINQNGQVAIPVQLNPIVHTPSNNKSLGEQGRDEEAKTFVGAKKNEVMTEQMAYEKVIQLMSELIIQQKIINDEFIRELEETCSLFEKLKVNQHLQKIIKVNQSCKICRKGFVLEEFSLIECEDTKKCMVCNKCRLKNQHGICDICKRAYTEYEKFMINFAKDDN